MPKQVRFVESNVVYTPSPATHYSNSLPSSSPSPPPSPVLLTPPTSLYHSSPLPLIAVQLHPILSCPTHGYTSAPPLIWDLSLPPNTFATTRYHGVPQGLKPEVLAEPATMPPLPQITLYLHSASGVWPWAPLTILGSNPHQPYVTVKDVLVGLYTQLRNRVSSAEFYSIPSQSAQDSISLSFKARCQRLGGEGSKEAGIEKSKGLKRIDFLMGRIRWAGLSGSKAGPDTWVVNVA